MAAYTHSTFPTIVSNSSPCPAGYLINVSRIHPVISIATIIINVQVNLTLLHLPTSILDPVQSYLHNASRVIISSHKSEQSVLSLQMHSETFIDEVV